MSDAGVDVLVSTFNEQRVIDACLDAILAQTVPVALTLIDGGSSDATVAMVRERARRDARVTVVADGIRRTLPAALNLGLARTTRPFVAKVDARTFLARDFIERALAQFATGDARIACTGGAPEQFGDTPFGVGLARARVSRFGVGGSQYADARPHADVDTIQCGVYRRSALDAVGHFDPALQFGEDEELNWRLRRAGYRLVRDASIRFRYLTRPTWRAAFAQYRNYGRARIAVAERHPAFVRPYHGAPAAALLGAATVGALAPFSRTARVLLATGAGAYASASVIAALRVAGRDRAAIASTALAFSALHAGYGVGTIDGALTSLARRLA
jgi:cellulose synthase/poly-beta-1,6-N-acetylglucosamine synthase-like glycosyltransferase